MSADWETSCPGREDSIHCVHWYDDMGPCCGCGDDTDANLTERNDSVTA